MKTNFKYYVYGNKIGNIWMPNETCSKNFSLIFTRDIKEPFKIHFESLRDILLHIINDGDFRSVEINECYLDISYIIGNKEIKKTYDLRNSSLKDEFFTKEVEFIDIEY